MKLSKSEKCEVVIPPDWKCYDGCPACRFLKKAAEKGKEISSRELEKAFTEADAEIGSV